MTPQDQDPFERMKDEVFDQEKDSSNPVEEDHGSFDFDQPSESQSFQSRKVNNDSDWITGIHASPLIGYVIPMGWVLAPLVLWLAKKDELPAIDKHGRKVLNFQISMMIYMAIAGILSVILIGIPILIVLGIVQLVYTIIGTVKASQGEDFKYPWTIDIL